MNLGTTAFLSIYSCGGGLMLNLLARISCNQTLRIAVLFVIGSIWFDLIGNTKHTYSLSLHQNCRYILVKSVTLRSDDCMYLSLYYVGMLFFLLLLSFLASNLSLCISMFDSISIRYVCKSMYYIKIINMNDFIVFGAGLGKHFAALHLVRTTDNELWHIC